MKALILILVLIFFSFLGLFYYQIKGDYQPTVIDQRDVDMVSELESVHSNFAAIYLKSGQHQKAVDSYKKVLSINPDSDQAWHNLGRLYIDLEKYQKAATCYQRLLELSSNNLEIYNDLGWVYGAIGKYQEAIDCFKKYIEHKPQDPEIYFKLGLVYFEMNKISKAKENFSQAKNLASKQGRALLLQSLDKALSAIGE